MGIISLRCRKICCIGRSDRLLQAVGSANSLPLPYYSVFIVIILLVYRPCNPHWAHRGC